MLEGYGRNTSSVRITHYFRYFPLQHYHLTWYQIPNKCLVKSSWKSESVCTEIHEQRDEALWQVPGWEERCSWESLLDANLVKKMFAGFPMEITKPQCSWSLGTAHSLMVSFSQQQSIRQASYQLAWNKFQPQKSREYNQANSFWLHRQNRILEGSHQILGQTQRESYRPQNVQLTLSKDRSLNL